MRRVHGVRPAPRIVTRAPSGEHNSCWSARANHRSVPSARVDVASVPSGDTLRSGVALDRVRGEDAGLERLRDPFAGHRVNDVRRIAREQDTTSREARGVEGRGDRPRAVRAVGLGSRPEDVA